MAVVSAATPVLRGPTYVADAKLPLNATRLNEETDGIALASLRREALANPGRFPTVNVAARFRNVVRSEVFALGVATRSYWQ